VVRVRYDDPADNTDKDDDGAIRRRYSEVGEEFRGVKELQKQMDERMKTLEDNVAALQRSVDEQFSDIRQKLEELVTARAS
jgi:predicted  nucleic acid-binding Zn-ribbon protein